MNWPWSELGLSGPSDLATVRHAYAECLKVTHPEEDPEGFQRLNEAYQQARQLARRGSRTATSSAKPVSTQDSPNLQVETPSVEESNAASDHMETNNPSAPVEEPNRPTINISSALDDLFATAPGDADTPLYPKNHYTQEPTIDPFELEQARRAEERERAAQARRAAFFQKFPASTPAEEAHLKQRWARIEAAEILSEVLLDSDASLEQWTDFLHSSIFLIIKGDPEFVAWFEDFLRSAMPHLSDNVKHAILHAFSGIDTRQVPKVWHGIHQILSGKTPDTDHPGQSPDVVPIWKNHFFRFSVGFLLVALFGFAAIQLAPTVIYEVVSLLHFSDRQEQKILCEYLGEDIGRTVESVYGNGVDYKDLYCLWDQPSLTFTAQIEGERDLSKGQLGYTTNFGNAMLTDALEEFAEQQGCELWFIDDDHYSSSWIYSSSAPTSYCIEVPMWNGEDLLIALSDLMTQLEQESWYQTIPMEPFEFHFAYRELPGVMWWYTYTPEQPFDGSALLDYYQNQAGADMCSYIVLHSGLADADFGNEVFALQPQGFVELPSFFDDMERFVQVNGIQAETGEVVRIYLYSSRDLYSLLPEEWETVQTSRDLDGDYFQPTDNFDLFRLLRIQRQS